MPMVSEEKTVNINGEDKPALTVEFTNGALEQLIELQKKTGTDDPVEVIELAVSVLMNIVKTRKVPHIKEKNKVKEDC